MIFALSLLPVLSGIGCAVDYSRATQLRSKLQAAADAASVGSIARNSPAYLAAGTMTSDGPISAGVADATNIFNGNMSGVTGFTLNSVTPVVQKLNGAINEILREPEVVERLQQIGFEPLTLDLNQANATFREEIGNWRTMVDAIQLKVE